MKKKKRILKLLLTGVVCLLALSCGAALWWRREINDTTVLRSYRIEAESKDLQAAEELKAVCRKRNGIVLRNGSAKSHLFIRFAADRERAGDMGYSLEGIEDYGYLIGRKGNAIYVLSPSEEGLSRGCRYLACRLVDERGKLLLDQDKQYKDNGSGMAEDIVLRSDSLSDYPLVGDGAGTDKAVCEFQYYFNQSSKKQIQEGTVGEGVPGIVLSLDKNMAAGMGTTEYRDGNIYLTAQSEEALMREVSAFANTYLNWRHAGKPEEERDIRTEQIRIKGDLFEESDPWIAEREAIITLWNVNYSRGVFLNNSTSLKTDLMSMSDKQLCQYVQMLRYCGFTGIQITEMCSAWAGAGGYEFVHEKMRVLADAAHEQGMTVTLWVWGAEFTGYGWVDNTVTYSPGAYEFAHENPDVIATFEKYYSIYTELADCSDRVIAHFYDPGNLVAAEDVGYFANLLRERFLAANPEISFGVSCWVDAFDREKLLEALGNQITLYEGVQQADPQAYADIRSFCRNRGCGLGTWAWNTCEMEIDQLAQMNFNPHYEQNVYRTAQQYDEIRKPDYWCEMDSNHVINVFSLYCAGQLLIDPNRSPEELTAEIAAAAVGDEYAADFAEVLRLLEDARTGDSLETYRWDQPDYIVKSKDYPAEDILARSGKAMETLRKMIDEDVQAYTLPLPLELREVLQLVLPQIEQIHTYAQFRIDLKKAEQLAESSTEEEMNAYLQRLAKPVSEYNAVTGLWGQIEARAQQELLLEFCDKYGFDMPWDPVFRRAQKNRIYDYFVTYQKGHDGPVLQYEPYFQYGIAYGRETTIELVEEMIREGLFAVDEKSGGVYLVDWEHYKYAFNY